MGMDMHKEEKTIFYMERIYSLKNDVYKIISSVVTDKAAAEDITQTVFEKAWHKLDDLREKDKARQWLNAIVRNEIRTYFRNKDIHNGVPGEDSSIDIITDEQLKYVEQDILDILVDRENRRFILKALELLDERSRQIIKLHLIVDLPLKQVAECLQWNYGSTRVFYSRAVKKLRDLFFILEKEGE